MNLPNNTNLNNKTKDPKLTISIIRKNAGNLAKEISANTSYDGLMRGMGELPYTNAIGEAHDQAADILVYPSAAKNFDRLKRPTSDFLEPDKGPDALKVVIFRILQHYFSSLL